MMRPSKILCLFTAALLLLCGCSSSLRSNPNVTVPPTTTAAYTETPASDFSVTDAEGNRTCLFDHLGTPVLVQFWPDPTALSERELDIIQHAFDEHGEEIVFLLVCPVPPSPNDLFSERGLLPLLHFDADGSAAAVYGVGDMPATLFIDADGFIATQASGSITEDALLFGLDLL